MPNTTIAISGVDEKLVQDTKIANGLKGVTNKFIVEKALKELKERGNEQ